MAGDKEPNGKLSAGKDKNKKGKNSGSSGNSSMPVSDNKEVHDVDPVTVLEDRVDKHDKSVEISLDKLVAEKVEERLLLLDGLDKNKPSSSGVVGFTVIPKVDKGKRKRKAHEISDFESDEEFSDYENDSDCDNGNLCDLFMNNNTETESKNEDQVSFDKALRSMELFFDQEEIVGDDLHNGMATIVDGGLRRRPNDKKVLGLADKHSRPKNVPNLTVPKTNVAVWDRLRKGPRVVDAALQKVQAVLAKSMIPVLRVVEDIGAGKVQGATTFLEPLNDTVSLVSASFSYLNQARKEVVRNDLHDPIAKMCTWDTPVGVDKLFGVDVLKKAKEVEETKTLDRQLKKKGRFGSYNNSYGHQGGWNRPTKTFGYQSSNYQSGNYQSGHYKSKKPFLGQSKRGKKRPSYREKN